MKGFWEKIDLSLMIFVNSNVNLIMLISFILIVVIYRFIVFWIKEYYLFMIYPYIHLSIYYVYSIPIVKWHWKFTMFVITQAIKLHDVHSLKKLSLIAELFIYKDIVVCHLTPDPGSLIRIDKCVKKIPGWIYPNFVLFVQQGLNSLVPGRFEWNFNNFQGNFSCW